MTPTEFSEVFLMGVVSLLVIATPWSWRKYRDAKKGEPSRWTFLAICILGGLIALWIIVAALLTDLLG